MQLRLAAMCAAFAAVTAASRAGAQTQVSAGMSVFREAGGSLNMLVLTPEVAADVALGQHWAVTADWTADVVSGASVAVVDAPAATVDAIGSASVRDTRHVFGGGLRLLDGQSTLSATYHYGFESDYRSHSVEARARTELFERNTALEISYARAFDWVCDAPDASAPVVKVKLASSNGCFVDDFTHRERELDSHTFQGAWTQSWTAVLITQLTGTAQLLDGFQANPYRAVSIGRAAAQEHLESRARYALGLGMRLWIRPLAGALQPQLRLYRDTWDVISWTAELGYEQTLWRGLRLRGRARYYTQSAAAFYSDDYVLQPKGQYFTGDRELSSMRSVLLGGQLVWTLPADERGEVLGLFSALELVVKADLLKSFLTNFTTIGWPRQTIPLCSADSLCWPVFEAVPRGSDRSWRALGSCAGPGLHLALIAGGSDI